MSEDDLDQAAQTATEHVAAAGLGVKARPSRPAILKPDVSEGCCTNCQTKLEGPVCHVCGQIDDSYHRPIGSLLGQLMEGVFHFDGRVAKTIPPLLVRPGSVTRTYLKGARARFIPPLRLYLLASLLFFLLVGVFASFDIGPVTLDGETAARASLDEALEAGEITQDEYDRAFEALRGIGLVEEQAQEGRPARPEGLPPPGDGSALDATGGDSATPGFNLADWPAFERRLERIAADPEGLTASTIAWIPRLMFALVPVYAGLLTLSFAWRRGYFYYDHLIVSLHFHAALFLAMSLGFLVSPLIGTGWVILALLIYSNAYLYRVMRVVYARGRATSVVRVLALDLVYFLILLVALVTAFILGVLSL